jgi:hypothetical protein
MLIPAQETPGYRVTYGYDQNSQKGYDVRVRDEQNRFGRRERYLEVSWTTFSNMHRYSSRELAPNEYGTVRINVTRMTYQQLSELYGRISMHIQEGEFNVAVQEAAFQQAFCSPPIKKALVSLTSRLLNFIGRGNPNAGSLQLSPLPAS